MAGLQKLLDVVLVFLDGPLYLERGDTFLQPADQESRYKFPGSAGRVFDSFGASLLLETGR